jgi:aspartyl-tRNA(Asn)/glutamyl-tRNA(Gln) amidotransferase subunit A
MKRTWGSIKSIAEAVNSGKKSAVEMVNESLGLLAEAREYNAVISVIADRSIERAKIIDELVRDGKNGGRLAGVPFIAKDNFLVFGADTTAASNILRGFDAPYQATAIERLEAEGAICVAKANLDAFAHGGSTENSDFGVTLNPSDTTRVAGGSSGGSAAAIALGLAPFALGTDTGGSIREPASFCGVVGLKPTYGLVSRYGVVAMASSTDVIGPITRSTKDASLVLDVLAGKDCLDSTTIDRQDSYDLFSSVGNKKPLKVGIVKEFMGEGVDEEVRKSIKEAVAKIEAAGHDVVEVSIPSIEMALACYYIIVPAEVSSNLSRYDGQRYGYSASDVDTLEDKYSATRAVGFNPENKRRILIGTYVLSSGYYDAYYKKAARLRTKLINEFDQVMKNVDFLIGPTVPEVAPLIGANSSDPVKMYMLDIMTVAVNLVGVPAISIPVKQSGAMPVGMQIIAPMRKDKELLAFADAIEGVVA